MSEYTINDRNGETRIEGTIDPDPAFNGGTITGQLRVDPTDNSVTAIRIDMAAGAAANQTDWIDVQTETAGHRLEADAAGNFFLDARPAGTVRITDNGLALIFNADGIGVLLGNTARTLALEGSNVQVGSPGHTLGFYGGGPVTVPDVTGSTAGNAALASLLGALAALGLITDSTT